VALTAPYMHDGRFATLMDVINHYDHGITANHNLDSRLTDGANAPVRMNMSEDDKLALVAFLNTFTDNQFVTDPKFSNPFK
jgi:cytochrome c peroxidase